MINIKQFKKEFEIKQNFHNQKISKDFKDDIDYNLRVLIALERKEAQKEYIKKKIKSIEEEINPKYGNIFEILNNLKADLKKLSKD